MIAFPTPLRKNHFRPTIQDCGLYTNSLAEVLIMKRVVILNVLLALGAALVSGCLDDDRDDSGGGSGPASSGTGNVLLVRNEYTWGGYVGFMGRQPYMAVGDHHSFEGVPAGTHEITFESRHTAGQQFKTRGEVTFTGRNEIITVRVSQFGIR